MSATNCVLPHLVGATVEARAGEGAPLRRIGYLRAFGSSAVIYAERASAQLRAAGCLDVVTDLTAPGDRTPTLNALLLRLDDRNELVVPSIMGFGLDAHALADVLSEVRSRQIQVYSLAEAVQILWQQAGVIVPILRGTVPSRMLVHAGAAPKTGRPKKVDDAIVAYARQRMSETRMSLQMIAAELGVSHGTLYRAFNRRRKASKAANEKS